jgi:hypothetical protein
MTMKSVRNRATSSTDRPANTSYTRRDSLRPARGIAPRQMRERSALATSMGRRVWRRLAR